ncbi:hypothetical protein [Azospirillum argentinense]
MALGWRGGRRRGVVIVHAPHVALRLRFPRWPAATHKIPALGIRHGRRAPPAAPPRREARGARQPDWTREGRAPK